MPRVPFTHTHSSFKTVSLPLDESVCLYRVSQKNVDLFLNWYNSFIRQGIVPKFCMVVAK